MMKTTIMKAMLVLFTFIFAVSCKKSSNDQDSSTCTNCATSPDAKPANDASSKGVYKGIVIGSSGTVMFDVLNGGSSITATLAIDGITSILTSDVEWSSDAAYVGNFTGTFNGNAVRVSFSVQPDGSNPVVTAASIPGHPNAVFTVVKETSSNLIECFEGKYTTTAPETGTFNLLLSRSAGLYGGIVRETGDITVSEFSGVINSANHLIDSDSQMDMGVLNGNTISGSFPDGDNHTVTISAKRTW